MTQNEKVLNHLQGGNTITPLQALNQYGCLRLAVVIHRLRKKYSIQSKIIKTTGGKHVAQYSIV